MGELANVASTARVVLLTVGVSVLTGLVFGLFSAFGGARGNFIALRAADDASTNRRRHRVRSLLVVSEMALSVVLLVGATLLVRTMINLYDVNPGFDTNGLYAVEIHLPERAIRRRLRIATRTSQRFVDGSRQFPSCTTSRSPPPRRRTLGRSSATGRSKAARRPAASPSRGAASRSSPPCARASSS